MESRLNKYEEKNETSGLTRSQKNAELYNEISSYNVSNFDVNSNTTVIGENKSTIDIDKLRDMLDKKYRIEPKKNKPIAKIDDTLLNEKMNLDETRDYDINSIINKAKEEKESNYEIDRLKKLRNTQVDILNELNIDNNDNSVKAVSEEEGEKLKDLIDTINLTEELNAIKDVDPLDLFTDLKGNDEETKVMGVNEITAEVNKVSDDKTLEVNDIKELYDKLDIDDVKKAKEEKEKEESVKVEPDKKIENSFYTTSSILKQSDFDDFSDLKEDITITKVIVRILIVLIIIAFAVGIFFLLNKILGWGLF